MRGYGAAILYRSSDTVAVPTCAVVAYWLGCKRLPEKHRNFLPNSPRAAAPLSKQRRSDEMRPCLIHKVKKKSQKIECMHGIINEVYL